MSKKINWDDSEPVVKATAELGQAEFLHVIFGDDVTRGCCHHISKKPNWTRYTISANNIEFNPELDCYYSVGSFIGEGNEKQDSPAMRVLVADDYPIEKLDELQITPTYILQTSERKVQNDGTIKPSYQVGFKISDGNNIELADRVMQSLYKSGYADKSGNNRVRLARLPNSTNNKNVPFKTKMISWNPSVSFSLMKVAELLDLSVAKNDIDFDLNEHNKFDISHAITEITSGTSLHDNINRLAMSQLAKGMRESDTIEMIQGVMLSAKAGYLERGDEDRWQERFDDIERSVRTANVKLKNRSDPDEPLLIPIKQWIDKMIAPDWVIDDFIGEGVRAISGAQGKGKTSIISPLCANVAHLVTPNFLTPKHRRVVFYFTEDTNQINRMIYGMKKHQSRKFSNPHEEWENFFKVHMTKRYKAGDIEDLANHIKNFNTSQDNKTIPPLVVFDTQAASFDIEDENNNAELSKLISQLKIHFWEMNRIPVWVITHITKSSMSSDDYEKLTARGAGAIAGDSNGTMGIVDVANVEGRILANIKDRDGARHKEVRVTIQHHSAEGVTPYGDPTQIAYFTTEYFESSPELRAEEREENSEENLLEEIYRAIHFSQQLEDFATVNSLKGMKLGADKPKILQMLNTLIDRGRIEKVENTEENRKRFKMHSQTREIYVIRGVYVG
jgi:hypothetical protein